MWWSPLKIVSNNSTLHSRWQPLLNIEISLIVYCCYIISQNELLLFFPANLYWLGNDHLTWRGRSYGFFLKKNILIPNVAEKNILILVEEKKKSDSEFLSYNLMLNSGKKIHALRDRKNKYSNSCVVRKNISEQNKKP